MLPYAVKILYNVMKLSL